MMCDEDQLMISLWGQMGDGEGECVGDQGKDVSERVGLVGGGRGA